jgi:hypothetical protein
MSEVRVPYRDRGARLVDAVPELARELPAGTERDTFRAIAFEALTDDSGATVGDLLARLEASTPEQRRRFVDAAREAIGAESLSRIEDRAAFEAMQAALPKGRDPRGTFQACHAPGCEAVPIGPTGLPEPVRAKRWYCRQHEGKAQPGDLEEPEDANPRLGPTFQLLPSRAEQARIAAEDDRRREAWRQERERQEDEARRIAQLEAEYRQSLKPPAGFGPP